MRIIIVEKYREVIREAVESQFKKEDFLAAITKAWADKLQSKAGYIVDQIIERGY